MSARDVLIGQSWADDYFKNAPGQMQKLNELKAKIDRYNKSATRKIDVGIFDSQQRVQPMLIGLNQVQLMVLQHRRELVAMR